MEDHTEEMEHDMKIASSSMSWDFSDDSPRKSHRLQSTLRELEQSIKAMQTLIQEEEDTSLTQRAETYFQKKPQLVKNMDELQRLFCTLAEHCSQSSARSSLSETSEKSPFDDSEYQSHHKISTDEMVEGSWKNNASKLATIVEESCVQIVELAKRNEEKREAKRELSAQVEVLMRENRILMEQQSKLMDEIGALSVKVDKLSSANRFAATVHNTSKLEKLKSQIFGKIMGGD